MCSIRRIGTLRLGDSFREWIVEVLGEKIRNKRCDITVFKIPASHLVYMYRLEGEGYGVVAKFYGRPSRAKGRYLEVQGDQNAAKFMTNEFTTLTKIGKIINVPRPLAMNRDFDCVLLTEWVEGNSLYDHMLSEEYLFERLLSVAHLLRKLHDGTRSSYCKEKEFAHFHRVLDPIELSPNIRSECDYLLGEWWSSPFLDQRYGCSIHRDSKPNHYIFASDQPYALDFESFWEYANSVHDLGIMAAKLRNYFGWEKGNIEKAEPYIGHFIRNYCNDEEEFFKITEVLPFFMSLGWFRKARCGMHVEHRSMVLNEALECLRAIKKKKCNTRI